MSLFSNFFSQSKKKEELVMVFDVGSSSVGGALFRVQNSGVPRIMFTVREPVMLEKEIDPDKLLAQVSKSLGVVAKKIHDNGLKGLGAPKKIFCVLSSPWYASQTRTASMQKNAPFIFNTKLADSLVQKEISMFEEEHLKKYIESGSKIVAIEFKNMKTILNGYPTTQPYNQKATSLEMVMFISMSAEKVLQKILDSICSHFYCEKMKFSSFAIAAFTVTRDIFAHHEDFLLIDIGGEVTDVCMVKKEILRESASFPVGPNFIVRGVARELGCELSEAKVYLSLYKDGHADIAQKLKLEPVINKLRTEWLKKFKECLVSLSNDISIPSNIFVSVDHDMAIFFAETIKSEQLSQYTITDSKFNIVFLNEEVLHDAVKIEGDVVRDPFLMIESIYINRFLC